MGLISGVFKPTGRHLRTTLVAGLLVILPVAITFLILKFVFDFFDPLLKPLFDSALGRYTPGMGIISLVIIIYLVGVVTTHVTGRRAISLMHACLDLVPVVRSVYRAARQATEVFSAMNNSGSQYSGVVLVDFPGGGLKSIGLITSRMTDQDDNQLLAVYVPTSPFPTSGFLVLLPIDQVTPTDIPVDDAMKMIISAGIMTPSKITVTPNPFRRSISVDGKPVPLEDEPGQGQELDKGASNQ